MPHCPSCRTEYRDGFDTCADCGGKLEPGPPPAGPATTTSPAAPGAAAAAKGWSAAVVIPEGPADPDAELEIFTGRFAEAGIEFQVEEVVESRSRRRGGDPTPERLPWYRIHVRAEDEEKVAVIVKEETEAARAAAREAYGLDPHEKGAPDAEATAPPEPEATAGGIVGKIIFLFLAILGVVAVVRFLENR